MPGEMDSRLARDEKESLLYTGVDIQYESVRIGLRDLFDQAVDNGWSHLSYCCGYCNAIHQFIRVMRFVKFRKSYRLIFPFSVEFLLVLLL